MRNDQLGALVLDAPEERRIRQQQQEQRREEVRRNAQFWFNCILTVSTILTTGIVLYQNQILSRTLDEMGVQSAAARESVVASREATAVSERLAREASEHSDQLTERS